jgi:hypothetical protein
MFTSRTFRYQSDIDVYVCPGDKRLRRKALHLKDKYIGVACRSMLHSSSYIIWHNCLNEGVN